MRRVYMENSEGEKYEEDESISYYIILKKYSSKVDI